MTGFELNRGASFAASPSYPIFQSSLPTEREESNNTPQGAKPQPAYCFCDYPLRDAGCDVLSGDPVLVCDGCGYRSDTAAPADPESVASERLL